jgi:hypothetical protein
MPENELIIWKQEGTNKLILNWELKTFNYKCTIIWRGKSIDINLHMNKTYFGHTRDIIFTYENKTFTDNGWKYKQFGGGNSRTNPILRNDHYELKIETIWYSLILTDTPLNNEQHINSGTDNIFIIKKPREYLEMALPKQGSISKQPTGTEETVTLFNHEDYPLSIESCAYFEDENLVVDYWVLTDNKELELFIIVEEKNLKYLYSEFCPNNQFKIRLLKAISELFTGKRCFDNFQYFLDKRNITYVERHRHDSK